MIIECEKCKSKFNIDEGLIKTEGSKVRCSICKTVFVASPAEEAPVEESSLDELLDEGLEETVPLDSPPDLEDNELESPDEDLDLDFEKALEEETARTVSVDELPDFEEEDETDMGEVIDRATRIEEDVSREDAERKTSEILEEDEDEEEDEEIEPSKKRSGRSRVLPIILVLILLLLIGGGAVFYLDLAPGLIPDSIPFLKPTKKQEKPDKGVARLAFKEVNGFFIQSNEAGKLFVVKGKVVNNYPGERRFIHIKGALLDEKGQEIKTGLIYAGNTFTDKQIKEMPIKELREGLRRN